MVWATTGAGQPIRVDFNHHSQETEPCRARWADDFALPGVNGYVYALTTFDDGSGMAVYAGGSMTVPGPFLARWDGTNWSTVGDSVSGDVRAMAVFDDGAGPALYVGGSFTQIGVLSASRIAKWDGESWSAVGDGFDDTVFALAVHNDGTGPALYAGGAFTTSGSESTNFVAKWNGSTWTALGAGVEDDVFALESTDLGNGLVLYVGGRFQELGGVPLSGLAQWDGASWSPVSGELGATVYALETFEDANSDVSLFVGGRINLDGDPTLRSLASWNGSAWTGYDSIQIEPYHDPEVRALTIHDDGSGPALFVAGTFTSFEAMPANNIAKWDGQNWSDVGGGVSFVPVSPGVAEVYALGSLENGAESLLFVGGRFYYSPNGYVASLAQWDGEQVTPLASSTVDPGGSVNEFCVFDPGDGPFLYLSGSFTGAGSISGDFVRWDGSTWSEVHSWIGERVHAMVVFDDGTGADLYVGGQFGIRKRDGGLWSIVGGDVNGDYVYHLSVFDDGDGPALYAGGSFTSIGFVSVNRIAKWDGITWTSLGDGTDSTVTSMLGFDDGTGPALFVIGQFNSPGRHIARWDGSSWTTLGFGFQHTPHALAHFDDGTGPALFAGGNFAHAGGVPVQQIAKWNGETWSSVGGGVSGSSSTEVQSLIVYDDGNGEALYAGGKFSHAGGVIARGLAKWNGTYWFPVGGGMGGSRPNVYALGEFNDGTGPALYVGGTFESSGNVSASSLAKWWSPNPPCDSESCRYVAGMPNLETTLTSKNRYLTVVPSNPTDSTALRVTLVDLPGDYAIWNGRSLWVNNLSTVTELSGSTDETLEPTFLTASLSCQPQCGAWGYYGHIDVFGEAIIPGAEYLVEAIRCNCDPNIEEDYSEGLVLSTSTLGDTVGILDNNICWWTPPNGSASIPFDTVANIEKFRNTPCAPRKARADLVGVLPNRACVDQIIDVSDLLMSIQGFQGYAYPYSPSHPDPCFATPCPNP